MPFEVHPDITANPNIQAHVKKMTDGRLARALALKRVSKQASLRATGIAKPASIVNFNPVPLRMESGIQGKIPSAIDPAVAEERRVEIEYNSRRYKGSLVTIRDPLLYPWIIDVQKTPEQEMADGQGVFDIAVCKQIEIVHAYWTTYNVGAHDSSGMGGVLIFEGDEHALKGNILHVPKFITLPDMSREYFTEPSTLEREIHECLDTQKAYYDVQLQIAQTYWDDPDQRKNITMVHRIWAQWGLDMGFREKPPEYLLTINDPTESCEGCGAAKKRALAYACHACGRYYDVFQAYMDKEIGFENMQMVRLKDEQWPLVHEEEARRRVLRTPPPSEPTEAPRKPK
jgi:hypothetical protein